MKNKSICKVISLATAVLFLLTACEQGGVKSSSSDGDNTGVSAEITVTEESAPEPEQPEEPYVSSPIEDFKYTVCEDFVRIDKYIGNDEEVFVPQEAEGLPVREIARAFRFNNTTKSVVVPNGVKRIEKGAFAFCTLLEKVELPKTLCEIGQQAFLSCRKLSEVNIPQNVKLGMGAFTDTDFVEKTGLLIIGDTIYDCAANVEKVEIPDNITRIADNAFNGCEKLEEITVPESVREIGAYAFSACPALKRVQLPSRLDSLGKHCFSYCSALESVNLPDGIQEIPECAFINCKELKSINIPDSVTKIGECAFEYCEKIDSIDIPSKVTVIENAAFFGCKSITKITLPDSLESLGDCALGETSITSLTIPPKVTKISVGLVVDCNNLTDFTALGKIEIIERSAFTNCISMEKMSFADVIYCDFHAFPARWSDMDITCNNVHYNNVSSFYEEIANGIYSEERTGKRIKVGEAELTPAAYQRALEIVEKVQNQAEEFQAKYGVSDEDRDKYIMRRLYISSPDYYDYAFSIGCHEATNALVLSSAVCDGISLALSALYTIAGYETVVLREYALNHCWIKLKVGDEWYNVDRTYSDYLVTDERKNISMHGEWNYSKYPDILTPAEIPADLYTIRNKNGDAVSHYRDYYSDKTAVYNPFLQLSMTDYNIAGMYTYKDNREYKSYIGGYDKRVETVEAEYFSEVNSSDLENRLAEYDYVIIKTLKDTGNTSELVIPDNVVQIERLEGFDSLTKLTYTNAITREIDTSKCPLLSEIIESDNLKIKREKSGLGILGVVEYYSAI